MTDTPMEVPGLVYITRSALELIRQEARRQSSGGQFKHETGGILIGRRIDEILLIAAATRAGDDALHAATEFNPDVEYANRHLREYLAIYPQMDFIGIWHQHPPEYPTFSAGDVDSAHTILNDGEYKSREIVNPIVWLIDDVLTIDFYYMNRDMAARRLPFAQVTSSRIVEDTDPLLAAEKARPNLGATITGPAEAERQRLLEAGYRVEVGYSAAYTYFALQHSRRPDLVVYAVTPPDYPRSAPLIAIEQFGRKVEFGEDIALRLWTTADATLDLVGLVEALINSIPPRQQPPSGPLVFVETQPVDVRQPVRVQPALPAWLVSIALALLGIGAFALAFVIWGQNGTASVELPTAAQLSNTANINGTAQIVPSPTIVSNTTVKANATATVQGQFQTLSDQVKQLRNNKRYEQAADVAQQALQQASAAGKQAAADQLADIYIEAGNAKIAVYGFDDAIDWFNRVKAINPAPGQQFLSTAEQQARQATEKREQRQAINDGWKAFDQTTNCIEQTTILSGTVASLTGWSPQIANYPTQYYDPRIVKVTSIWSETSFTCAQSLQFQGQLEPARELYRSVQQSPDVTDADRSAADQAIRILDRAKAQWAIVNTSSNNLRRRAALEVLIGLPGFGGKAQNPAGGKTAATILASIPTPTPIPTATPVPPTATPAPPTETPAPPTETPAPPTETPLLVPEPTTVVQ